jgi:hypothetical protein
MHGISHLYEVAGVHHTRLRILKDTPPLLIDTLHSRVLFLPRIGMIAASVPLVHERMPPHGWLISGLEEKAREDTISLGSLRHEANLSAYFSA